MPHLQSAGHVVVPVGREASSHGIVWDLANGGQHRFPADAEAVVHLAQSRNYRAFPADAEHMFAVNVAGTHAVLAAAAAAGIKRFCLVSSGAVYEPFLGSLSEEAPLNPSGFLGASKLAGEVVARPYAGLMSLSILRLFFPYGPGQSGRLVPEIIRRVRNGVPIDVSTDGEGLRLTPTHVDDVCDAIVTAIEGSWVGTINVAAPSSLSIAELGRQVGSAIDRPVFFNPCLNVSPPIVPDLTKLGRVYDLGRMRTFQSSVSSLVASG